jgi:hypothetical protein
MLRAGLSAALVVIAAVGMTASGAFSQKASAAEPPADTFSVAPSGLTTGADQLTVVLDSPSALTGVTAEFETSVAGAAPYTQSLSLQSTETDPQDSNQTQTTWTVNIAESALPLGNYALDLLGTFSDSTSYTAYGVGTFSFDATSSVTLAAAHTSLGYPNTAAGLTGTVTLTYPDGTPDTDYSGLSVLIIAAGTEIERLNVAGDGTFSDPSYAPAASESLIAEVSDYGIVASVSNTVALTVNNVTPHLALTVNHVSETYGKTATVTGTVSYTSGTASLPVAGQEVWVGNQEWDWGSPLATTTTNSTGGFSITVPAQQVAATLYIGTTNASYLTAVETPLQVDVVNPTVISGFKAALNQDWKVALSGCLAFASGNTAQSFSRTAGLTAQYQTKPNGAWLKLGTIPGNEAGQPCGTGGIKFTGTFTAPLNYARYRVVYAGTTGATSYAATASSAVLAWRYADRITGFKVSPTVVNAGGKLTVKGVLQYYYDGWRDYAGQVVTVNLNPRGSKSWYWFVKVKTNSKGQFSATFKDPVSANWQAGFAGNDSNGVGHLETGTPAVYVRLK